MKHLHASGYRMLSLLALVFLVGGLILTACGSTTGGSPTSGTGGTGGGQTATTGGTTPATGGQTTTTGGTGSQTATGGTTPTTAAATGNTQTTATTPTTAGAQATGTTTTGGQTATTTGTQTTAMTPPSQGTSTGGGTQSAYKLAAPLPKAPGSAQPNADPNATLTLNNGNEVSTVDPQVETFANEVAISDKVYAPLLVLNKQNEVAANVATSMDVSQDGKTYTFKLQQTKYSDGQPVTAKDYAYAITRACDPNVHGGYSNIVFAIVGCQDWRLADPSKTSKAKMQQMESKVKDSIKSLDPSTLQIKLAYPAGYFPYVMTTWITYPVRQDLVEKGGANWWQKPQYFIGNGPFALKKWEPKQQWTFERNDNYFRGEPGIKTLIFKEVHSAQTEFLAYKQKQFDVIGLDPTLLPQVQGDQNLKQQLHRKVTATTFWIRFNLDGKPFNDVKVRQAFAYATNRERYIKQVNNGVGVVAGQLLYKGIAGYTPKADQTFDPQKAKQLLADAGFPNGKGFPTLKLYYDNQSETFKKDAVFWAQNFSQVLNINLQPTPMDGTELQHWYDDKDPRLKISVDYGWAEDYPHPQDWLSLIFGNNANEQNSLSPRGWNDKEFNDLVNKADKLPIDQAKPLYEQAETMLSQKAPVSFVFHQEALDLIQPNVKGYVSYPTGIFDTQFNMEKIYKTKS